ncbi:hypothetical protein BDV95DRAFT_632063 [Massariosphaeria phaeospora]|uniref:Uncharacterized protein n=1 Tax=Massariosphaeria phaeospora TaxID=100035 RepID=A0A7C8M2T0_9PLEO|nr:hypothetical protein BDV95DRAFT_632063 [Massariosphaeria phaeospora]
MLRGHKESKESKEAYQRDTDRSTPLPTHSQVDLERLKAATPTPVLRAEVRLETPDLLQRPKTSNGPADRGRMFHKKVAPAAPNETDDQAFVFPFSSPSNRTTVLYAADFHEEPEEGIIGIALGSPTMTPHWDTTLPTTGTVTHISSGNRSQPSLAQPTGTNHELPKPKLSRWKSLFKKNPQQEKISFYQLAQSASPARADSHHDDESLDSQSLSQLEGDYRAASPPTFKPEIRESRRVPKGQAQPSIATRPRALTTGVSPTRKSSFMWRSTESPKPAPKGGEVSSASVPKVVVSGNSQVNSPRTGGGLSLLDVDIPDVHLERYSVMFGSLLESSSAGSSSLLARRQGNSEKLKPLNTLSAKHEEDGSRNRTLKPQRRATSPSFPRSPSVQLSLFPAPTPSRAPSPRPSPAIRSKPLQRSMTAPAKSPSRQNFPLTNEPQDAMIKTAPQDAPKPAERAADQRRKTQTQILASPPSPCASYDSSSEISSIVGLAVSDAHEPERKIMPKPIQITKSLALSSHPSSAPLAPPAHTDLLKHSQARLLSPALLSPAPRSANLPTRTSSMKPRLERAASSQATVGVARSVSVSRAKRPELLSRPVLVKRATGAGERLGEQRSLTPCLVELENRRSQRVQLVNA